MLIYIWAQDEQGLVGKDNTLPWRLPNDWKFFKEVTMGQTILMGRKNVRRDGESLASRTSNYSFNKKQRL